MIALGDYCTKSISKPCSEQGGFGTEVPEDLEAVDDLTSLETILQAVRRSVEPATKVRYAEGCGLDNGDDVGMRDAIKAASGADVAIVVR
jgi:beta-glucosidase